VQHAHARAPQHQRHEQQQPQPPTGRAGLHPNFNPPYLQTLKTSDQGFGGPCASVSGVSSGAAFDDSRGTGTRERVQERESGKTMVWGLNQPQAGREADRQHRQTLADRWPLRNVSDVCMCRGRDSEVAHPISICIRLY
jgi:hypothetical protein